jgi:hypothetical protein
MFSLDWAFVCVIIRLCLYQDDVAAIDEFKGSILIQHGEGYIRGGILGSVHVKHTVHWRVLTLQEQGTLLDDSQSYFTTGK